MKQNVLLIMVDSLRADHCWGDQRRCRTPALDQLCRNAVVCTRAFSTASITTTCTTSILTGAYPFVHGINTFVSGRLRPSLPTLPEVFKAHGYHTWAEMTGPLEPITGLDRGFDDYHHRKYNQWLDTDFGDDALIDKLKSDLPSPWFGCLHLWEIHNPRQITAQYNHPDYGQNPYERAVSSLDHQLACIFEAVPTDTVIVLTGDHGEYLSSTKGNDLVSGLKRSIRWIKRRSRAVKQFRLSAMTALMKTMNGLKQRENDFFRAWQGHGFHVYDSLVHVPLIFYGPGLFPNGMEVQGLTSHVDIFPTLVAALGLNCHAPLSGINLMPYIQQPTSEWNERAIYLQASGSRGMVEPASWLAGLRTERYKYVRSWSNRTLPEELYDLEFDPAERANLANKRPDLVRTMRAHLDEVLRSAPESLDAEATAYTPRELDHLTRRLRDLGYVE
jgi:arylsulfatase A-like enzyme